MTALNKQALREAAEKALPAMQRLLMMPNDELFDEASLNVDGDVDAANAFNLNFGPETALALLDALEAAENSLIDSECHVAELEEALRDKEALLEAAEKRIAEQREYYEGVIADGSRRIAELEARTVTLPEPFKLAKSSSVLTYYYADEVDAAIQAAGIGVKGE